MSEETVVPVVQPEVEPAEPVETVETVETVLALPAELPELIYAYQPLDEHNRPLGGKQVIKYRTPDELAAKLSEQNTLLIRKLRSVTRDQRLGISPVEDIPAEAERMEELVEFKPRELNSDERMQLSQDLNDPERFVSARDRLFESAIGVSPERLTQILNKQQMDSLRTSAKQNYDIFVQNVSDYYNNLENAKTLTDWMFKNKLAPSVDNFQRAYSSLKSAGLLVEAPVVRQEVATVLAPVTLVPVTAAVATPATVSGAESQPSGVPPNRIVETVPPQEKRQAQVPSGLTERNSSTTAAVTAASDLNLTLADIDKMSADNYKLRMKNPAFRKLVDRLEGEATARRLQSLNRP